jgi:hypothetical protein
MIKNIEGVSMMSMSIEGLRIMSLNSVSDYEHWGCEHDEFEQCEW